MIFGKDRRALGTVKILICVTTDVLARIIGIAVLSSHEARAAEDSTDYARLQA
jgi:hypothetical protein